MRLHGALAMALSLAACACDPGGPSDAGTADASCSLDVALGTGDRTAFTALGDGDPVEVILGFQGFRMLRLALLVEGEAGESVDLTTHLAIVDGTIEIDQRDSRMALHTTADGSRLVYGWLIFFNDAVAAEVVGHDADLEVIARGTTTRCIGATRLRLALRDDEDCVDPDASVPDASFLDGGIPDGAVVCGAP